MNSGVLTVLRAIYWIDRSQRRMDGVGNERRNRDGFAPSNVQVGVLYFVGVCFGRCVDVCRWLVWVNILVERSMQLL